MSTTREDFQKIHADFRPRILRYLTRLVGAQEAEDLTQEVFVKVSRALNTFRGESQISTWIYRIATNTALDRLREPDFNRARSKGLYGSEQDGEPVEALPGMSSKQDPVEQQACSQERIECYRDYVQALPLNYRTVVALSELEELTANEIADILGLSVNRVKIRLHRGRARLLKELKAHCKPEDWL